MLASYHSTAERVVPQMLELLSNGLPVFSGGDSHEVPHKAVPDASHYLRNNAADCEDTHPETVSDGPVGVSSGKIPMKNKKRGRKIITNVIMGL